MNQLSRCIMILNCSCLVTLAAGAQENKDSSDRFVLKVDAAQKFQRLDGIGVNVNTRSWDSTRLEPAINVLQDSLNSTIWRVIAETVENWEVENDNEDPFSFNWDYYDKLYETTKFRRAWDMIAYLNKRGITDNLMINFMGVVPKWMGEEKILPQHEDEYVEMIVSFFYYAVKKKNLKIGLISHMNEPDIKKEGPTVKAKQYAALFSKFIKRMQQVGLGDIKYVGPDVAGMGAGINDYLPEMMKDTTIMNHLAHVGLHSYAGSYAPVDSTLKLTAYPKTDYWITEWNEWCPGCDDGKIGTYDFAYASRSVRHMINLLEKGASALILWEAYDSYYEHHAPSPFSYWGVLKYEKATKTYTKRAHFNTISQISRFIHPGATRIGSTASTKNFYIIAVEDSTTTVRLLGINTQSIPVTIEGSIENSGKIKGFHMSHTTATENLHQDKDVKIKGKKFKVTIPANAVFALSSF